MALSLAEPGTNGFYTKTEPQVEEDKLEPIAVVGFGLKFPQDADTAEGFWKMLVDGRSAVTEVPKDRWNIDSFYHPNPDRHDSMNARRGHFLKKDVSLFDAPFFSIPPAEAECMDPQQRSLLECTYHAFENAGIPVASVVGSRTSCYVGSFSKEYETVISRDPQLQAKYIAVGTGTAMLSNRLSWFYDLRGPSISLDTACSSSLIALHLAVQSMRSGESDLSIVAGCNLILSPETNSIPLSNLGLLGKDGVCYSFDHRANGYARGEGTAVMVLKPLEKALKDGDIIRAVIRNTGTNQDGKTPGITQPSRMAQEELIQETYLRAGLDLKDTGFFEAHGTGTPLGDPREAGAIGSAFKDHRTEPLVIGAVKSNVGHLEGASGLAGLIKTILILEKGVIPRNIWFEKLNPEIKADEWKLKVSESVLLYDAIPILTFCCVNSFGYGGANAHVIVDDAYHYLQARNLVGKHQTIALPPRTLAINSVENEERLSTSVPEKYRLFAWSAYDEGGLKRISEKYQDFLENLQGETDGYLDNLAYTLSNRRSNMPWKSFLVAKSVKDMQNGFATGLLSKPVRSSASLSPTLAFVFTGQGAQWYAMGRELMIYPKFENSLRGAEKYLSFLGSEWKLTEELSRSKESSAINNPALAQPLCTALQIALVDLLEEWNISPSAMVGHSSGEIAAAYCAGAISKESAYKIAYFRGALAAKLARKKSPTGAMLAVAMSDSDIQPILDEVATQLGADRLVVGCVNSPKNVTLTGDEEGVDLMQTFMNEHRIFARKLQVPVAYHSPHMQDVASEYLELIKDIIPRSRPSAHEAFPVMFSSVTGDLVVLDEISTPEYWVKNMVSQVMFSSALNKLCESLVRVQPGQMYVAPLCLVEIGPHAALQRPVRETIGANTALEGVSYDTALTNGVDAIKSVMNLVGNLHCRGYKSDILALNNPQLVESELQLLCDLPEYPFNHSQSYWLESRISQNYRFGELPRHELLGVRTTDWNPLEAKWRNTIRASELPWLKDHKVNGSELYPAAGMLVMAIEASRQMASRPIASYKFENVSFHKALLVNLEPEGVESQFHLRPQNELSTKLSDFNTFNLYLHSSGEWAQICSGTIITNYEDDATNADQTGPRADEKLRAFWKKGVARCTRLLDSRDLYENLESFGFAFGPTFQTLKQVRYNKDFEATASVDLCEWMGKVKDSHLTLDHVIHPTALDAVMHLAVVAESKGTSRPVRTMVPTKIEKLWISNDLLAHSKDQKLQIFAHPTFQGYRDSEIMVAAFDNLAGNCQILLEGYRATAITNLEPSSAVSNRFAFDIDWKPDVDLLTTEMIAEFVCAPVQKEDLHDRQFIDKAELLCHFYIHRALERLTTRGFHDDSDHTGKYIEWMKKQLNDYNAADPTPDSNEGKPSLADNEYFQNLVSEVGHGSEVDLLMEVGDNLAEILCGEVDALGVLFGKNNLAKEFYGGKTLTRSNTKGSTYIDLLAHKNPTINILEVGTGTGGITATILDTLSRHGNGEKGVLRLGKYTYTDISSSFFEAAGQRFHEYIDKIEFKVLDIERDPIEQGFELDKYDIVVASAVLHATSNLEHALQNVRKVMKPNAKLVMIETNNLNALRVPFIFGVLPGWWLSVEEYRYWSPLLSDEGWHTELQNAGFTGADICLRDFQDFRHTMSVIVSTATPSEEEKPPTMPKTIIVVANKSTRESQLVDRLKLEFSSLGVSADAVVFEDLPSLELGDTFCISLVEMDKPLLYNLEARDWESLKSLVRSATGILWLTRGLQNDPALGLVTGLGRTLRSEFPHLNFIELAIEATSQNASIAKHVVKIFRKSINLGSIDHNENEYLEKGETLYISRVVEANYLNDHLAARIGTQRPEQRELGAKPDGSLSLAIHQPGLLNTLYFQESDVEKRPLAANEVEVQVKATGLNFKDIMIALGQLPSNTLGLEFSGVILRLGSGVSEDEFQIGDHVCGIGAGALSTKLHTNSSAIFKIPENMSFSTAAAFPLSFSIAHYGLINLANLREGESLLIHSGAGAIGQAAIQLAKRAGADIYCTVGRQEKKELLSSLYQIPEHRIFVGKGTSFIPQLKKVVDGVDVILNSLGGKTIHKSLDCILPFGRFVDISQGDKSSLDSLPRMMLAENITYSTVNMALILEKSRPLIKNLMKSVRGLLVTSEIKAPSPLNIYKSAEIEDAFRVLHSGDNTGKTVIEMHDNDVVTVVPSTRPSYNFRQDASYVISGGLGGLGKSTATWMADRGATNLILLGRSGMNGQGAPEFVEGMRLRGVTVAAPSCDISNESVVKSVLETCTRTMPAIKGCIQGSMVLRDGLFENMSLEDYNTVVMPKARGSWNLHKYLPENLDFFILLASASGVGGTRGQSNYASGNTYQDALARYRVSRGLKCISLDLGLVLGVGFAAENRDTLLMIRKMGYRGIYENEYLMIMDYLCDATLPIPKDPLKAQVVIGLEIPKVLIDATQGAAGAQDWARWVARPLFRNLAAMDGLDASKSASNSSSKHAKGEPEIDYKAAFEAAGDSVAAAAKVVSLGLRGKLARILRVPEEDIETQKSIHAYGVDSLVAVELRYWLAKEIKSDLNIFEIMGEDSLGKLSWLIAKKSTFFIGEKGE